MRFKLMYLQDCPNWQQALENLRQALQAECFNLDVSLVLVENIDQARDLKFRGSPTICLSDQDIFPDDGIEYGMSGRVYRTEEGLSGYPTVAMLRKR